MKRLAGDNAESAYALLEHEVTQMRATFVSAVDISYRARFPSPELPRHSKDRASRGGGYKARIEHAGAVCWDRPV